MTRTRTPLAVLAILALALSAQAMDESEARRLPGYVDFDDIQIPEDAGKMTSVNLDPLLIGILAEKDDDPEFKEALAGIRSIRVKAFEADQDVLAALRPIVDGIDHQLKRDNWRELIRTREGDELVVVSMKVDAGRVLGLLVVALEKDEAAFVNIVGDMNLAKVLALAKNMDELDLEEVEDLMDELEP